MVTQCLLVCEGSSDAPLAAHIQRLLESNGCHPTAFDIATDGRRLVDKVQNGLRMASGYDLLFVHRDSDRAGADARHREIAVAVEQSGYDGLYVGVVPVRMTEAWLLLDDAAIRNAVMKPGRRNPLDLPTPAETERMADPKAALEVVLMLASGERGRRRRAVRNELPKLRRQLLESLPVGGPLERLESWTRFRDDTIAALQQLNR